MNIIISEKSPVYGKVTSLAAAYNLDASDLAAGLCHAALCKPQPPAAAPAAVQPAPAAAPAAPAADIPPAPSMGLFKDAAPAAAAPAIA